MASVALLEAAESTEAVEAEESAGDEFTEDSRANAESKGVNFEGFGKIIGLGLAIHDLIRTEGKLAQETADRKMQRYMMGIVYPSESRDDLVSKGLIPSYFAKSEIRKLIRDMKLPHGWSIETAVNQGFGKEINSMRFRKTLESQSSDLVSRLQRERELRRAFEGSVNIRRKLRLNRFLETSKARVM